MQAYSGKVSAQRRAKIFISHAAGDNVAPLVSALAKLDVETFDDCAVPLGASWQEELDKRLREADAFVLLVGPRASESQWLSIQWQAALEIT